MFLHQALGKGDGHGQAFSPREWLGGDNGGIRTGSVNLAVPPFGSPGAGIARNLQRTYSQRQFYLRLGRLNGEKPVVAGGRPEKAVDIARMTDLAVNPVVRV